MKKMLTNKQISEKARGIYRRYWGQGLVLHFYLLFVLMLILAYPNIYKVKVDLGLTDEEMTSLYGDQYMAEQKDGK